MTTSLLAADNLAKGYGEGSARVEVLASCTFDLQPEERVVILGQSGVGKSTLLHLLAGLDRADRGEIRFGDRQLHSMAESERAEFRNRHVGLVFQFYHLLPEFTALENVMMPLLIARNPSGAVDRASALLEEVGLEARASHFPSELSGGERQRVAIARALAAEPDVLLADEPTGNLDAENGRRVMEIFDRLHQRHRTATVLVTHNPELARGFDRVLQMQPGGALEPVSSELSP
jgi:lipoprotein-releasing system ATP-binding protein